MDKNEYARMSMTVSEQHARYEAGVHQMAKVCKYTWSDGSVTWCGYCHICTGDAQWAIHHAAVPLDDVVAKHLAEKHPPKLPSGFTVSTSPQHRMASCDQCGWEKIVKDVPENHAVLVAAAERHVGTTHLPPVAP